MSDCADAVLVTLGDGVNQNAVESTLAVGAEYVDPFVFDVYAMTHPSLSVDYRFVPDGHVNDLNLGVTVDAAGANRFAMLFDAVDGHGTAVGRARMWARYVADETVMISRKNSGRRFTAWIQGIDCSGIVANLAPVVDAGEARTIVLPNNSVALDGTITTHNGGVKVFVGANTSSNLDCRTHNGSIRCKAPLSDEHRSRRRLTGRLGGGDGELAVTTHNGGVRVDNTAG